MSALANSFISARTPEISCLNGSSLKSYESNSLQTSRALISGGNAKRQTHRRSLTVKARSDNGGMAGASIFVGGFVLGGIVVGALGCVFAPQISKALTGTERKDLMRKLPKFIYDEEKALEKTRQILSEKIAQLNAAIDDVSTQLHADDNPPNGAAVNADELEASI